MWSGKGKPPPGSKGKPSECGLTRKNAAWVKGKGIEVWSDKKKRRLGQRESHRSVAWWEKALVGSKRKPPKCGLTRKSAGWVKGKAVGVWSGGKNRWLGQRESHRSVVWWEKTMVGSKEKPPKCGLARKKRRLGQRESHRSVAWQGKTAAWVKEKVAGVWSDKKKRRLGQRNSAPKSQTIKNERN